MIYKIYFLFMLLLPLFCQAETYYIIVSKSFQCLRLHKYTSMSIGIFMIFFIILLKSAVV